MSDPDSQARSPAPSKSPKRVANRAKGAVRAKSGCYTCRIRRKKCDEMANEQGNCQTCVRLRLECLGFGPKRPDWMRENNNVPEMREKIKNFLAKQGMIKGHSGSGPRSNEGDPPLLLLNEFNNTSGAVSPPDRHMSTPSSDGERFPTGLATSNVRQVPQHYPSLTNQGVGGGTVFDRPVFTPQVPQFDMNSDASYRNAPALNMPLYTDPGPLNPPNVEPVHPSSSTWVNNSVRQHQKWTNIYGRELQVDVDDESMIPRTDQNVPFISDQIYNDNDILPEHYRKNVVGIQYILADRSAFEYIFNFGQSDGAVRAAMCHLASVHRRSMYQGSYEEVAEASLQVIRSTLEEGRRVRGHTTPSDAMASLHTVSGFLFSGGRGSWKQFLEIACDYVEASLMKSFDIRNFLPSLQPLERFIVRTTMWFEVLASITIRRRPRFLDFYREVFGKRSAFIEDETSTSMMNIMGCENEVLFAIAETSALAEWKAKELSKGRLSIPDLVDRGRSILGRLMEVFQRNVGNVGTSTLGADHILNTQRLQTAFVFRAAAKIYLHNVVSGDQPLCPEIMEGVKETIEALKMVDSTNSRSVVRSVVFPICIAGCLTDNKQERNFFLHKLQEQQKESIGNCSEVEKVMKQVWEYRDRKQPISWLDATIKGGYEPLLLV